MPHGVDLWHIIIFFNITIISKYIWISQYLVVYLYSNNEKNEY